MKQIWNYFLKMCLVLGAAMCVSAFASGASTVHASESEQVVTIEDADVPQDEAAEQGSAAALLLMGGLLVIIIAVVVTAAVSSVISAVAAEEA